MHCHILTIYCIVTLDLYKGNKPTGFLICFCFFPQKPETDGGRAGVKTAQMLFAGNGFQTWCHAAVIFFSLLRKTQADQKKRRGSVRKERRLLLCGFVCTSAWVFHLGLFASSHKHRSLVFLHAWKRKIGDTSFRRAHQWAPQSDSLKTYVTTLRAAPSLTRTGCVHFVDSWR